MKINWHQERGGIFFFSFYLFINFLLDMYCIFVA